MFRRPMQANCAIAFLVFAFGSGASTRAAELVDASFGVEVRGLSYKIVGRVTAVDLPAATTQIVFIFTFQVFENGQWKDAATLDHVAITTTLIGETNQAMGGTNHLEFEPDIGQKWRLQVRGYYEDGARRHDLAPVTTPVLTARPMKPC